MQKKHYPNHIFEGIQVQVRQYFTLFGIIIVFQAEQ
jgi:hypothetical protein